MGNRLTQLHNTFCSVYYILCWLIYDDLNQTDNRTDSVGRQWAALCLLARWDWSHVCAAACRALAAQLEFSFLSVVPQYECWSWGVGAASGALHRPDYGLWAAHRAVLKPFIHLSAVLALETFPESFYSSSPFLIVIFQYMLTVQWVIMGGSIWPHHLWVGQVHVCFWVVNPLTTICLKQVSATVFMLI